MAVAPRKPTTASKQPAPAAATTILLPRGIPPMAAFFVAVPALTILAIGIAVMGNALPLPLTALLAIVVCSCGYWIKIALPQLGDVSIELTAQDLVIKRLTGRSTYPWSQVESVKLFDPGSTMADSSRNGEGRVGIGLFLRSTAKTRTPDSPPDVTIITGSADTAEPIIKACERITSHHRRGPAGANGIGFGRNVKGFRKPAKQTGAAA